MTARRFFAAILFASVVAAAAAAESLTELPTGGIEFIASDPSALVLQSEEVALSPANVKIVYVVANKGAAPLELTLGFRLPELDFSDPDAQFAIPGSDPINFLAASFYIDGKEAPFAMTQRASLNGKDVTDVLRQTRLALAPLGAFQNELAQTSPDLRDNLAAQGLVVESGTTIDGKPLLFPSWTVKTNATRKMTLAPQQSVKIELRYRTSLGASPDTILRKALREQKDLSPDVNGKRATYCVDDAFLSGLDKLAGAEGANGAAVKERRIHLAAKHSAPNPIVAQQYKLLVDKGSEQYIVSFCSSNLKKISATAFEMRAENYSPGADLKVLLIDKTARRPSSRP